MGLCEAIVQRVSYTGDLGYEIYVDADKQRALYHTLAAAGEAHGMKPFGMRAMMSLRLEKFFGSWMREFRPDYMPCESGMDRFVKQQTRRIYRQGSGIGRKRSAYPQKAVAFVVDAIDADVVADEPIYVNGQLVGFVTSGGYAHGSQCSVALGMILTELVQEGLKAEIEILGQRCAATLVNQPLFDADNAHARLNKGA